MSVVPRRRRTLTVWMLFGSLWLRAHDARADECLGTEPVPGMGVDGSWELAFLGSFQRLSDGVVTTEVRLGVSLGRYVTSWLEPFVNASVNVQDLDGGASGGGTAIDAAGGVGGRASIEVAERVHPYLALSPGFLVRSADIDGFESTTDTDFVTSLQLGLQVTLVPRVALDVAIAYDRIFSDRGEDLWTVPLGLSFFF